jgi:putative transposase
VRLPSPNQINGHGAPIRPPGLHCLGLLEFCLQNKTSYSYRLFHFAVPTECQIIEGHLLPDHVHMCIAIPPKYPVASVIGFLKGKSAIAMAHLCGKERNFTGEHFWARGYLVSTVGFELEQVRKYVRE